VLETRAVCNRKQRLAKLVSYKWKRSGHPVSNGTDSILRPSYTSLNLNENLKYLRHQGEANPSYLRHQALYRLAQARFTKARQQQGINGHRETYRKYKNGEYNYFGFVTVGGRR
jgi:hypothetical protein